MKTVFVAVNSSYVHTNPAVRSLAAAAEGRAAFLEYNINQDQHDVLRALLEQKADAYLFSCYIWNIAFVLRVAEDLKRAQSQVKIALGGPEVSFCAQSMLCYPFVDYVLCGEGEEMIGAFLRQMKTDNKEVTDGVLYRSAGSICGNDRYQVVRDLDSLPLPFSAEGDIYDENRIYYYESSRGCPFSCAYCLSGAACFPSGVREKSLERVKREIDCFVERGVRLVKFVDRTFNANGKRANEILEYVIHQTHNTSFHFEVALDLMDGRMLALLKEAPQGKIQLEAGVQSTNVQTLELVIRTMDVEKLKKNAREIMGAGNIHLHLDLIAGLPGEGLARFGRSFNEIYELYPDALQLGFLKILHGSVLEEKCEELGIVARSYPPYEVIRTRELKAEELLYLKGIEALLNRYYNTGRARTAFDYLTKSGKLAPFELYEKLFGFCRASGQEGRPVSARNQFVLLIEFAKKELATDDQKEFFMRLRADYIRTKIKGIMPEELRLESE